MAEGNKRKVGRVKKDLISELPQNVQEIILCFLPIQDAARTSILSSAWKDRWTMIPCLIFDYKFISSMLRKFSQYDDKALKAHKFASVINKAILLHNGPINKFSLVIPGDDCDAQIIHDYIDQWIPLFSKNGIKQLILEDSNLQEVMPHKLSSLDLTHLRLLRVWFPYKPSFKRFSYLTTLELFEATSDFGESIFDCPVLEKLALILCNGLFPINFCAPNLKCLHQIYYKITSEYSLAGLKNLKEYFLLLMDYLYEQDLIFETKTSNVVKILDCIYKIEKFSIAGNSTKYLAARGSPNRLSQPLPCLKTLNFSDINFNDLSEFSCLLCLIHSAPNLNKLHISTNLLSKGPDLKNYWIEDSEDFTIDHLEIVTFNYFKGLQAELELVKFLLALSPMLKTIFIHRSEDMGRGVALTLAETMLKYSRSSSRAEISHLKHPVEINEINPELWGRP